MPVELVVVGASRGGLDAIPRLLSELPGDLEAPVVVVLHRAHDFQSRLDAILSERSGRQVTEPEHGTPIADGQVFLAPAGYHLLVDEGSFSLSTEGPVQFSRPSIDVTMDSAAQSYGPGLVAIVMTGGSCDGANGARSVLRRGGTVMYQRVDDALDPTAPRAVEQIAPSALCGTPAELAHHVKAMAGGIR